MEGERAGECVCVRETRQLQRLAHPLSLPLGDLDSLGGHDDV